MTCNKERELGIRHITNEDHEEIYCLELSEADQIEVRGQGFMSYQDALVESAYNYLSRTLAFYDTDTKKIIGIFGCSPEGVAWMLCSEDVKNYRRSFLRGSKKVCEGWCKLHKVIYNDVWEGHTVALQWLRWLGFKQYNEPHYGLDRFSRDNARKEIKYITMFK